jgi:spore maturation protein CgeB
MTDFLQSSWPGEEIDLCFGLFHDIFLTAQLMDVLRRRCRRIVNYPLNLLDQPHRFERTLQFCDDTFCAEEEALVELRSQTTNRVVYVPMAADPFIFRPVDVPQSPQLLFVGSVYADRPWFLDRCATAIPTSVYGSNYRVKDLARAMVREAFRHRHFTPPRQAFRMLVRSALRDRRIVSDEEFVRLVGEHGVTIGLASVRQERTGRICRKVRLRDYESTMCGACHIASRLPELERGFEEGKEIIFYESVEQLHELLSGIRRGQILWRDIGHAARLRAERDHSWTARLREAFS